MSKFFEALERAERERTARAEGPPQEPSRAESALTTAPPAIEEIAAPEETVTPTQIAARFPATPSPSAPRGEEPPGPRPTPTPTRLVMYDDPTSAIAESFRVLRAKLEHSNAGQPLRRLLITSAVAAEGKSTTAANLAVALAESNQHVLLVDANLRDPSLHAFFDQSSVPGLSSYLAGDASLAGVIHKTCVPNVSLVAGAAPAANPVELLSSPRMRQLLEDAGERFDIVVLDSPPVLDVADACVLAPMVDGVLLVVRAGQVARESFRQAKVALEAVRSKILGAVLNRAGGTAPAWAAVWPRRSR